MMREMRTSKRWRMSEWLDIMLSEIARKKQEEKEAREESARRNEEKSRRANELKS